MASVRTGDDNHDDHPLRLLGLVDSDSDSDDGTRCTTCGEHDGQYYSCCGNPTDGSSGTGCDHEDGEPTCQQCGVEAGYWDAETDGE